MKVIEDDRHVVRPPWPLPIPVPVGTQVKLEFPPVKGGCLRYWPIIIPFYNTVFMYQFCLLDLLVVQHKSAQVTPADTVNVVCSDPRIFSCQDFHNGIRPAGV